MAVWLRTAEIGARASALAAATALASPYLFVYDLLILVIPFLWLIGRGRLLWLAGLAWAVLLLGLVQTMGWSGGPNLAPLAALLLLTGTVAQLRFLSASASETVPEPRGAALG